jgi:hypothetical protein
MVIGGLLASAPAAAIFSIAFAGEAQVLPDHTRTPGVTNPDVTPETMKQTICNPGGWHTSDIRPLPNVMAADKIKQIDEYGYDDKDKSHYEEDHLIALEVGGNPTDTQNLWPESYKTHPNAHDKDRVENYLNMIICAGEIELRKAQQKIATDWVDLYNEMNARMLHDPELRSALLGPETEINPEVHAPSPEAGGEAGGGAAAGGAPADDEGLNTAQWHWIATHQSVVSPEAPNP